jgi:hypothetical protein
MELRMKVRAKEAELKTEPTEENNIATTVADAIKNSFTSAAGKGPKANEWSARSARLVAGWALGKKIATAQETINFYTNLDKKVEKITKASTKFSKPSMSSPKHAPFRPHPHVQLIAPPLDRLIPTKPGRATTAIALV